MISTYGYITGEFDIDSENDHITEVERINDKGDVETIILIETNRYVDGLNVNIFKDANECSDFLTQNGVIE